MRRVGCRVRAASTVGPRCAIWLLAIPPPLHSARRGAVPARSIAEYSRKVTSCQTPSGVL